MADISITNNIKDNQVKTDYFSEKNDKNKESLTVCGYLVPKAGRSGVKTASLLREGLMIVRDTDKEVMFDPAKQILIDKLVRKLSIIPSEGLSLENDIPEIINLAKLIGLSREVCSKKKSDEQDSVKEKEESRLVEKSSDFVSHKDMLILSDSDEIRVPILVSKYAEEVHPKSTLEKVSTDKGKELFQKKNDLKKVGRKVVKMINHPSLPSRSVSNPSRDHSPLVTEYLSDQRYCDFINEFYPSPSIFQRILETTIFQVENDTVDSIGKWLGEKQISPFIVLESMSVGEVVQMSEMTEIRTMLIDNSIKYETFIAWIDLIEEMQLLVEGGDDMVFGELFARWVIESEIKYVLTNSGNNSQVED